MAIDLRNDRIPRIGSHRAPAERLCATATASSDTPALTSAADSRLEHAPSDANGQGQDESPMVRPRASHVLAAREALNASSLLPEERLPRR
jgi:hypothetical protein